MVKCPYCGQGEKDITKILIYKGKYGNMHFDISTEEQEQRAYLFLFGYLDRECGYYRLLDCPDQTLAWHSALRGSWQDARWLLQLRRDYAYEGYDIEYCISEEHIEQKLLKWGLKHRSVHNS